MKKLIVLILLVLFLVGCGSGSGNIMYEVDVDASDLIPLNADLIRDHGNGWVEFELEGNRYLFRHLKSAGRGYSAVTQIR